MVGDYETRRCDFCGKTARRTENGSDVLVYMLPLSPSGLWICAHCQGPVMVQIARHICDWQEQTLDWWGPPIELVRAGLVERPADLPEGAVLDTSAGSLMAFYDRWFAGRRRR